jgi:hypothetical protein
MNFLWQLTRHHPAHSAMAPILPVASLTRQAALQGFRLGQASVTLEDLELERTFELRTL